MATSDGKLVGYKRPLISCLFLATCGLAGIFGLYGGGFTGLHNDNGKILRISHWNYTLEDAMQFAKKNILKKYSGSSYSTQNLSFDQMKSSQTKPFDIQGNDVIVFLHIQKTAGTTFEKFLTRNLVDAPCKCVRGKKRCKCFRPNAKGETNWLFSRYSTGWSCGLHADWTELVVSNCVDNVLDKREVKKPKRRYFITTFLREPVTRFISEYRHVNRGATWAQSRHHCGGRPPTPQELPWCFDPEKGWSGVSLDEFLDCPFNLAENRQTRMLADLTLVGCYNASFMPKEKRDTVMLESAKKNLRNMAFFGLQEDMAKSQVLFEEVFGLKFTKNMDDWSKSKSEDTTVTEEQKRLIVEKNRLDLELYDFAKQLFSERFGSIFRPKNRKATTEFESDLE